MRAFSMTFPWLFHDFPGFSMTYVVFHYYPGLEFGLPKSHDFPWLSRPSGHPASLFLRRRPWDQRFTEKTGTPHSAASNFSCTVYSVGTLLCKK